jgi:hypothetical protein
VKRNDIPSTATERVRLRHDSRHVCASGRNAAAWQAGAPPEKQVLAPARRGYHANSVSSSDNRVARLGRRQVRYAFLAFSDAAFSTGSAGCLSLLLTLALEPGPRNHLTRSLYPAAG